MAPETLSAIVGSVLSLAFAYIPGLSDKYEALDPTQKRLVMLVVLVVAAVVIFGLGCANWFNLGVTCDKAGAEQLLAIFLRALAANQATYLISSRSQQVPDRPEPIK